MKALFTLYHGAIKALLPGAGGVGYFRVKRRKIFLFPSNFCYEPRSDPAIFTTGKLIYHIQTGGMSVDYMDRLYNQGAQFAGGCTHYCTCYCLLACAFICIHICMCNSVFFFKNIPISSGLRHNSDETT